MSGPAEVVSAIQALVAGVADVAADPAERIRLLTALATVSVPAGGNVGLAAVGRRVALAALTRAAASCPLGSYEDAEALRTGVCGLLVEEETVAADGGEDEVVAALRTLREAVDRDLRRRGADLSPLRSVEVKANLPALVLAHRLYGDATRAPEMTRMAGDPPNPLFMSERFRALAR